MKNIILSYVYNILSENEKEVFEAITLTDSDKAEKDVSVSAEGDEIKEDETHDIFYIPKEIDTHDLP